MTPIATLIDRAADCYGDRLAVVDGDRRLTFRQVGERSSRLANALLHLGSGPGARVALLMPNRLEVVENDFGIAKAGMVRVPLNPRLADLEREYLLADSGAETLIFDPDFEPFVEAVKERLPSLKNLISLGNAPCEGMSYTHLLQAAAPTRPRLPHPPDAPNFLLYTSGTTGRPKGAMATNRSRLAATMNMLAEEIDAKPGDTMAHIGSMSHGSGSKVLAYFLRGACNLPIGKFEPDRFLALVESQRVTATFVVPTMIAMLCQAAGASKKDDLSSLKTISYGGAPIAPTRILEAIERFGPVFVQVYGSCEAPHPVTVMSKDEHLVASGQEGRLASVGREVVMAEVRIVTEGGADAPIGEHGEMWIRGDNVMAGYWGKDEATREVFEDGWYRSGDVAWRDVDGYLYIVDRARDMIISGGLNVYPAEVEAALHRHEAVAECAVVGVPDDLWGESVKAFIVLRPGMAASEDGLIEHTRKYLAGYKKPRSVEFVAGLPKGPTGKVLKRELEAAYWAGKSRRVY